MSNDKPESEARSRKCKNSGAASCYLLPCPFCGHEPEIVEEDRDIYVACSNCDSHGEWFNNVEAKSKEYAKESWNRRDPLKTILTKAESMIGHPTDDDLKKFVDWMKVFVGR